MDDPRLPKTPPRPSLDPHETNLQNGLILPDQYPPAPEYAVLPLSLPEATFRHSHWAVRRLRTWEALHRAGAGSKRLDRFANCGSHCHVLHSPSTGRLKLRANYCHDRICEPCCRAKSRILADRLAANLSTAGPSAFITLTLRKSNRPLDQVIDRLYRSFNNLRRRPQWEAHIAGGAAMLEVKRTPHTPTTPWHVHLHCVVSLRSFWPQKAISELWHDVTGDSYIVDIRAIRNPTDLGRYVAKYAAKGSGADIAADPADFATFIMATKARRLCLTFGNWRGIRLNEPLADCEQIDDWQLLCTLNDLLARAALGQPLATMYLTLLRRDQTTNYYETPP